MEQKDKKTLIIIGGVFLAVLAVVIFLLVNQKDNLISNHGFTRNELNLADTGNIANCKKEEISYTWNCIGDPWKPGIMEDYEYHGTTPPNEHTPYTAGSWWYYRRENTLSGCEAHGVNSDNCYQLMKCEPVDGGDIKICSECEDGFNLSSDKKSCTPAVIQPKCNSLTYNGQAQNLVTPDTSKYTIANGTKTDAGSYNVTITLNAGQTWVGGGSSPITLVCAIGKATPAITLSPASGSTTVGGTTSFTEKANVTGYFSVSSADSSIATASHNAGEISANTGNTVTVTGKKDGSTTINVAFVPSGADANNYNSVGGKTYDITVTSNTNPNPNTVVIPTCNNNLTYNGQAQNLINPDNRYTVTGGSQTNAGSHNVTVTLNQGYTWSDGTSAAKQLSCTINKAKPSITLSPNSGNTTIGATVTFTEKANVAGKFSNSSGDSTIATATGSSAVISANTNNTVTVRGIGKGQTDISVTFTPTDDSNYESVSNKFSVNVESNQKSFSCNNARVGLAAECNINGYTVTGGATSANPGVAKILSVGTTTLRYEGVSIGNTTITITTADGDVSANVSVTAGINVPFTKITISGPSSINIGEKGTYTVTTQPSNADDEIIWSISDTSVAMLNRDTGEVTGLSAGDVVLTAKSRKNSSVTASITITVNPNQNCQISLTNVSGYKHMSLSDPEEIAKYNITGDNCGIYLTESLTYFAANGQSISGRNLAYKPTITCKTAKISGCIKGTNICSDTISIELRPDWKGPSERKSVNSNYDGKKYYSGKLEDAKKQANVDGVDEFYHDCKANENSNPVTYTCNYYWRGCDGGNQSQEVSYCYKKQITGQANAYCWGTRSKCSASEYPYLQSSITSSDACNEYERCYKKIDDGTYVRGYFWGQTDVYEPQDSFEKCSNDKPACYVRQESNGNVYCWSGTNDCSSYPSIQSSVQNEKECTEYPACYQINGSYVTGRYNGRYPRVDDAYCGNKRCYFDKTKKELVWGDYSNNPNYELKSDIDEPNCKPKGDIPGSAANRSVVIYLALFILVGAGVWFIYYANVAKRKNS